jgi:hypothetical protein
MLRCAKHIVFAKLTTVIILYHGANQILSKHSWAHSSMGSAKRSKYYCTLQFGQPATHSSGMKTVNGTFLVIV